MESKPDKLYRFRYTYIFIGSYHFIKSFRIEKMRYFSVAHIKSFGMTCVKSLGMTCVKSLGMTCGRLCLKRTLLLKVVVTPYPKGEIR